MVANSSNLIVTVKPANQRSTMGPRRGSFSRTSNMSHQSLLSSSTHSRSIHFCSGCNWKGNVLKNLPVYTLQGVKKKTCTLSYEDLHIKHPVGDFVSCTLYQARKKFRSRNFQESLKWWIFSHVFLLGAAARRSDHCRAAAAAPLAASCQAAEIFPGMLCIHNCDARTESEDLDDEDEIRDLTDTNTLDPDIRFLPE